MIAIQYLSEGSFHPFSDNLKFGVFRGKSLHERKASFERGSL